MTRVRISAGPIIFDGRFEEAAPKTCALFRSLMPYENRVIHVRWSGEAVWIPLGAVHFDVGYENQTSYPAPGQIIFYPGGVSEAEILLAYGPVRFSSKVGQLAGNHFMTIESPLDKLRAFGEATLWQGAQPIRFEIVG